MDKRHIRKKINNLIEINKNLTKARKIAWRTDRKLHKEILQKQNEISIKILDLSEKIITDCLVC